MAAEIEEPALHPPDFTSYLDQPQSPLFSVLPAEIRSEIFAYALADFEDPTRLYQKDTYWTRPGYNAPRHTCTELLRTCKRIYLESWFMPFALAKHVFYLTAAGRAPHRFPVPQFHRTLDLIHRIHGDVETGPLQFFAQLYILEPGLAMQRVLDAPHLHPKSVALTIRYTDFWHWESDRPLFVGGKWVDTVRFPDSVTRFTVDFESVERRREEVDYIAGAAVEAWRFRRRDGALLVARREDIAVSRWTGSSLFGGRRWVRDERRPGQLDYYIATVTWRLDRTAVEDQEEEEEEAEYPTISMPDDFDCADPPFQKATTLSPVHMRAAGVWLDTPADEALAAVESYLRSTE